MPRILSDGEIGLLIAEKKTLPQKWEAWLKPKLSPDGYLRKRHEVTGEDGHDFVIDVRASVIGQSDFSVILPVADADGQRYVLARFNGRHLSDHTNKWEKKNRKTNFRFRNDFHIHRATERYQLAGFPIDGYAEPTRNYSSFDAALRCFVSSNGFVIEREDRPLLDRLEEGAPE
jgi:hypothetical protein